MSQRDDFKLSNQPDYGGREKYGFSADQETHMMGPVQLLKAIWKGRNAGGKKGSGDGPGGPCGVGMFVESIEGADGDEIYMPVPDIQWHM